MISCLKKSQCGAGACNCKSLLSHDLLRTLSWAHHWLWRPSWPLSLSCSLKRPHQPALHAAIQPRLVAGCFLKVPKCIAPVLFSANASPTCIAWHAAIQPRLVADCFLQVANCIAPVLFSAKASPTGMAWHGMQQFSPRLVADGFLQLACSIAPLFSVSLPVYVQPKTIDSR